MVSREVTGEKNGTLDKAKKMSTRCLGVQLGHPAPGGYKCGGLALQVGGWAIGRQFVAVKMLSGNLNGGLGTVRLIGMDLASGKGLVR